MNLADELNDELVDVAVACCAASCEDERALLGRARDLIAKLSPDIVDAFLPGLPSDEQFAQLISAQAYESAAIRLLGANLGYMISRSPGGVYLATVYGPGVEELAIAGESQALSLTAALLTAIRFYSERCSGAVEHTTLARLH